MHPLPGQRPVTSRTGDPAELARMFAARLEGLAGLQRALAAWTLARDLLERNMERQVEAGACHKGCAWCCNFEVTVRFADAAQLARRARAEPALEAKVRATAARVAHLEDAVARLRAAIPCAFLDPASGACRVYADRPLACRAYRSRDALWCRSLVGTDLERASGAPVIQAGLGIRRLINDGMVAVTPTAWRAKGELHAMVVRLLDQMPPAAPGP